jgi:hypothetical protein
MGIKTGMLSGKDTFYLLLNFVLTGNITPSVFWIKNADFTSSRVKSAFFIQNTEGIILQEKAMTMQVIKH